MADESKNKRSINKEANKYYEKHHKDEVDEVLNRSESWQAIAKQFDKFSEKSDSQGHIVNDIIFSGKMLQGGRTLKMQILAAAICKKAVLKMLICKMLILPELI